MIPTRMIRSLCKIACILAFMPEASSKPEFYGATMSVVLTNVTKGKILAEVNVMTGWRLGSGPCGPTCSLIDVGNSSTSQRTFIENKNNDFYYFGNFTVEYQTGSEHQTSDLYITSNYTEHVVAVSTTETWELLSMKFYALLQPPESKEDIVFDGKFWYSHIKPGDPIRWHLQVKLFNHIRNDTNTFNRIPRAVSKPYYKIQLEHNTTITIPVVDDDGDFLSCKPASGVESFGISFPPPDMKGIHISGACSVTFEAYTSNNFIKGMVIPVVLTVKDFPRYPIEFGAFTPNDDGSTLSKIPVQFLVEVVQSLDTPRFVPPTYGSNHQFVVFKGASWETTIYVNSGTSPLDGLRLICDSNHFKSSIVQRDPSKTDVSFATVYWADQFSQAKKSIVCVTAIDQNMVESAELLCFLIEYIDFQFTFSQPTNSSGRPHFINVPSQSENITCPINATCIIPVFVFSSRPVSNISIIDSRVNFTDITPVSPDNTTSKTYRSDLYIRHLVAEEIKLCLKAEDINGNPSDVLCFRMDYVPPDPCLQKPCLNDGICFSDKITGDFVCKCINDFTGQYCDKGKDPCTPNPCRHGVCYDSAVPYYCYCTDDGINPNQYEGDNCEICKDPLACEATTSTTTAELSTGVTTETSGTAETTESFTTHELTTKSEATTKIICSKTEELTREDLVTMKKTIYSGYTSCVCNIDGKSKEIIKKQPVLQLLVALKMAGFGAAGMTVIVLFSCTVYALKCRSNRKRTIHGEVNQVRPGPSRDP
ncbi:uncharacterized protein LOC127869293 [Dreissena polymorpha]|uniref:uncharacterized protein LOC127869293 n=1 Tax=Dreissena polymorpha TaxID=45954 RepID=UPI002265248D|nr:uncharacterized protein LOC127869293 [Dreissena polymorpha]